MMWLVPLLAAAALAVQPGTPAPAPPQPAPAQPQPEPSLDDLLNLPKEKPARDAAPTGPAPDKVGPPGETSELDRKLADEGEGDDFQQAVRLIDSSAQRLVAKDASVETQRLQDLAIKKLDKLIADAQKQQKQGGKSKPKPQQNQQQQQQQQQQQSQANSRPQPSAQAGVPSVPRQDGPLTPPPPSASASWGNLPEHVRQSLMQGSSDRFSSIYRAMTERYYQRLAEERRGGPR